MTWACKRCGLQRDPWVLVCDVDGALRFEPESDDRPTRLEPVVYGPLERVHRGEVALIGEIADVVVEPVWERAPFRPVRFACIVAVLWIAAPLAYGFFQRPSIAPIAGLLLAIAGVPLLVGWAIAWVLARRRGDAQIPGPVGLFGTVFGPLARWVRLAFPQEPRPEVAEAPAGDDEQRSAGRASPATLATRAIGGLGRVFGRRRRRPPTDERRAQPSDTSTDPARPPADTAPSADTRTGPPLPAGWVRRNGRQVGRFQVLVPTRAPIEIKVPEPTSWPPVRMARVRVIGRWRQEPTELDVRTVEAIDEDVRVVRPVIHAGLPAGWLWVPPVLIPPAIFTGVWLANVVVGAQ